jgi:hypothetical protein
MGNPSLRSAGEKVSMTPEQIQEYIKCKDDIIYFAETFFMIQTIDEGRKIIKLWDFQKKLLKAMKDPPNHTKHICLLSSRQLGKSQVSAIFLTHYALFESDDNIIILANKESTAKDVLEKIKIAIQNFPLWLQKGVEVGGWNKNSIKLENGICVIAASSSSDSVRGKTSGLVFLDEASFVPSHIWPEFWNSVYSIMSSGKNSKLIMVSTPKGLNHFYEIYSKAVRGENNFYPIKITWRSHPKRDAAWAENMKKDMGLVAFNQEHECHFLGSSNTLINPDFIENMQTMSPTDYKYNGAMHIYEQPEENCKYILGCDPAKGLGSDFSTIQVLKINSVHDVDQVAIYRNNTISPESFAVVCIGVSDYYNKADIMVESNDIGSLVCDKIFYEYENESLINYDKNGLGIRSTKKTKLAGNLLVKKYVENGYLQINDVRTMYEFSRYVEVTPGVFSSDSQNEHDDCVTSMIWALFYLTTDFYDPDTNGRSSLENRDGKYSGDDEKPVFISSNDDFLESFRNDFSNGQNPYGNNSGNDGNSGYGSGNYFGNNSPY